MKKKLPLILGLVGFLVIGGFFLTKKKKPATTPAPFPISQDQPPAPPSTGWKNYQSDELGFSLQIPTDWLVEEATTADGREIMVTHPGKLAFVRIIGHQESGLDEPGALDQALQDRGEGLEENPRITLTGYAGKNMGDYAAYMATGEETIDGQTWQFSERGVFGITGKIILMHGATLPNLAEKNDPFLNQIMDSFSLN